MDNKKILMVIAPNFRDPEYFEPKKIFEKAGFEVKTASWGKGEVSGVENGQVRIDLSLGEVELNDFEAIVFVGGPGMVERVEDPLLTSLAKEFSAAGKLTAAICVAPAILAQADLVRGKKVTAWSGVKDVLEQKGATYTGEAVTVDNKMVTASGPIAAEEFGRRIVSLL